MISGSISDAYIAVMTVASFVSLVLGVRAWSGSRKSLSRSFAIFEFAVFGWCLFAVIEWLVPEPERQYEALRLQYYGISFLPGACFLFARALASRPIKYPLSLLPLVPGAVFSVVIATNGSHLSFWTGVSVGPNWIEPSYGWVYWIFVACGYLLCAMSIAIIGRAARKANGVYARWMWRILYSFLLPFASNAVYIFAIAGKSGYDLTPIAFAINGFLLTHILRRYDVFDPLPYAKSVILESIDTPMLVVDAEDYVVGANDEAHRVFSSSGSVEGRPFSELVPAYRSSMGDRDTMHWSRDDVDYLITCYVIQRDRADWRGRLILFRDISELTRANRELDRARARAEAANASKSAFVAIVSHELRNPLNAIIGLADLNLRRDCPRELEGDFETIRSSGWLLLGIVNDLLDISKMEAGKLELECVDFDVHERVALVSKAFKPTAAAKGLRLEAIVEEDCPRFMKGDPQRFEQVLMNLLGNAVKFTPRGSVTIRMARFEPIGADADPRTAGVRVEVRDTGIGISPEGRARLFKDFSQADRSIAARFGGTGLGLSVSKRIIELMGGGISVQSWEGIGSVFAFTARFEPGDSRLVTAPREAGRNAAAPLRVLVVDDDPMNAEIACRYIAELGHEATSVGTGAEAVESLLPGNFDLSLVDIGLPDIDGLEVVRRVRAEESRRGSSRSVLASMTASVESDLFSRCESAGVDDLLTKPLDPERLGRLLERFAKNRASSDIRAPGGRTHSAPAPKAEQRKPRYVLIDEEALLARLGGDRSFMKRILGIFIAEAPARIASIDASVAESDLDALRCAAHGLRGASLTLRAEPLSVVSGLVESGILDVMGRPGFHGFEVHAESLKALLGRTVEAASGIVAGIDCPEATSPRDAEPSHRTPVKT